LVFFALVLLFAISVQTLEVDVDENAATDETAAIDETAATCTKKFKLNAPKIAAPKGVSAKCQKAWSALLKTVNTKTLLASYAANLCDQINNNSGKKTSNSVTYKVLAAYASKCKSNSGRVGNIASLEENFPNQPAQYTVNTPFCVPPSCTKKDLSLISKGNTQAAQIPNDPMQIKCTFS